MEFIKNFDELNVSKEREIVLHLIDAAFSAIQPQAVMDRHFNLKDNTLSVQQKTFELANYKRIFVVGFGKGSAGIVQYVEKTLGNKLTDGYDIDNVEQKFVKVHFTLGTHPLPSEQNIEYTKNVLHAFSNLSETDLVIVVVCGGGSAMFEAPHGLTLKEIDDVNAQLLKSGATIAEMNVIRKHVSKVKGGKFAKHLYPAHVVTMLFSDVPGSDFSVIASGPTIKDKSTIDEYKEIIKKYHLHIPEEGFGELPQEDKYFTNVHNVLMVSNMTAIHAMEEKAKSFGIPSEILSDKMQGEAHTLGKKLISIAKDGSILLIGGETTHVVKGNGKGGRNQELVLSSLPYVGETVVISSFDSDGMDFTTFAGAIGDKLTVEKAKQKGLDPQVFLLNDDSTTFFQQIGDGIDTGKLESNVSDLMIVYKK